MVVSPQTKALTATVCAFGSWNIMTSSTIVTSATSSAIKALCQVMRQHPARFLGTDAGSIVSISSCLSFLHYNRDGEMLRLRGTKTGRAFESSL
jgi:hypothetical protein